LLKKRKREREREREKEREREREKNEITGRSANVSFETFYRLQFCRRVLILIY